MCLLFVIFLWRLYGKYSIRKDVLWLVSVKLMRMDFKTMSRIGITEEYVSIQSFVAFCLQWWSVYYYCDQLIVVTLKIV